jgi:UDP:flavonoid glycosyltransferase YjiC (YdhE family)
VRILVVSSTLAGHLSPLLPVIRALVDAGGEVVVVSGPAAEPLVERTGATFRRAGNDSDVWLARLKDRTRGEPGEGIAPERINHYFVPRLFAEIATADVIDDVVRAGKELAPDLVLFESPSTQVSIGT